MNHQEKVVKAGSWFVVLLGVLPGLIIWYWGLRDGLSSLTLYRLFPVLGLTAFGLMWGHYIVAAARKWMGFDKRLIKVYFSSTSIVVLLLILLHPGLLILQLWNDGFGLPPGSYLEHYVAPSLKWAVLLGSMSFVIFLLYELHRWFGDRPWWRFVQYTSDLAMIAILVHGFKLGSHLQSGWFQVVWLFYSITLFASFAILYIGKSKLKEVS